MSFKVDTDLKTNEALVNLSNKLQVTIRLLLDGIHQTSTPLTPMRPLPKGGTLRAEVVKYLDNAYTGVIEWRAPYAWYQERGYTTGPIVNHSTPGTISHFAEVSTKRTLEDLETYCRMGGLVK